ncbi:MAG: 3'-5' exonuclease [Bacteroidaceae bacterium]|nr:3'-5' exonuclease [Bacteroidaceae bacterium]
MKLNLTRPLVFFDLETTGLDIVNDRIIQLSYIKVYPDGHEERGDYMVNPCRPIPPVVAELTHITNDMVKDQPTFADLKDQIQVIFMGCDIAGFNSNHFDVPLLAEEFVRVGIDFDFTQCHLIDVQNIYHKNERRNLAAAYKFYCGRNMDDDFQAHRADQDTEATYRVLMGQLDKYAPANEPDPARQLKNDVESLAEFSKMNDNIDFAGRIIWKEETGADGQSVRTEIFNFGKYRGIPVRDVLLRDPGYYSWMLGGDFSQNTKKVLKKLWLKYAKR